MLCDLENRTEKARAVPEKKVEQVAASNGKQPWYYCPEVAPLGWVLPLGTSATTGDGTNRRRRTTSLPLHPHAAQRSSPGSPGNLEGIVRGECLA